MEISAYMCRVLLVQLCGHVFFSSRSVYMYLHVALHELDLSFLQITVHLRWCQWEGRMVVLLLQL